MSEENQIRDISIRIRDHYLKVVRRGKIDQTRIRALAHIDNRLLEDKWTEEQLKLAATRYAMDLPKDPEEAFPMACRTFYQSEFSEFLSDDWEPPKQEEEDERIQDEEGYWVTRE